MKKVTVVFLLTCIVLLISLVQHVSASVDDFDSYLTGELAGQGNWYQVGSCASLNVIDSTSFSSPNCVYMKREGDVGRYAQYDDGNTDPDRNLISLWV